MKNKKLPSAGVEDGSDLVQGVSEEQKNSLINKKKWQKKNQLHQSHQHIKKRKYLE